MAVKQIVKLGHPVLRQKAKKIGRFEPWVAKLAEDMFETMHAADGMGLAAPQIAQSIRLFVIEYDDDETGKHHKVAMANPEIIEARGEQIGADGCLSIPGYYGVNVSRADKVVVKGQDVKGKSMKISGEGLFAWALQHEIDHLDGVLYIDLLNKPEDLRRITDENEVEEAAEPKEVTAIN